MSVQAYEWVTMYAPIPDHAARVVLYCLADRAGTDGRGAYPSSKTISEWSGIDARNVRRELKKLEQGGWIRRGHPSAVAHIPAHLRPTVWDLNLSLRRPADPGHSDTPCHDDTPVTTTPPVMVTREGGHGDRGRGVMVTREGGHGDAQTVHEPSLQPSLNRGGASEAERETPAASAAPQPREEPKPPKRKKPRHPITDDWTPRPDVRDQMAAECPTVDQDTELLLFRDHFLAKAETSTDWNLNYRGWCRRQHGWNLTRSSGRGNGKPRGMTPAEILAGIPGNTTSTTQQVSCTQLPAFPTEMEIIP